MKKSTKKFLVILSCCLLSCSATALAGCDLGSTGPTILPGGQETEKTAISFSTLEKSMVVGDEEYLIPNYKKLDGYSMSYESSDPSVVSVNNDGKISAMTEGIAIVKAVYSNGTDKQEASITITCSFGGYLPELKTMGVANEIAITLNSTYAILPYIYFNGKQFDDMTVTYNIEDATIAEIAEDGVITAKNKGETRIFLEASWRGKDKTNTFTLQKTINLSVIDDVSYFNAGQAIIDEALFTLGEFDGKSYKNTIPNEFTIIVNGEELPATVSIENEDVLEEKGNKLVAKAFGSTEVTVSATTATDTYLTTFNVTVKRIEKNIASIVPLFGTLDGTYFDTVTREQKTILEFIGETSNAVDAYQKGKELRVEDGKVFGVNSSSAIEKGMDTVEVGTDTILYHFNVETLAKVFSTAEDLNALKLTDGKIMTGYYEVMNNIDASGVTMSHTVTNGACFAGIFNGAGYTISNLSITANQSMFGVFSASATVKNLALIDLNASESFFLAQNTLDDGVTMTDLYLRLSESTHHPRGITGRTAQNSMMKNVVIEYLGENAEKNRDYENSSWNWQGLVGGVWRYQSGNNYVAQDKKWSDVYVISPFVVSFNPVDFAPTAGGSKNAAAYGYGANETTDVYGNSLETSVHTRPNPNLGAYFYTETYCDFKFTNLYHYASYADLSTSSSDFSNFSTEYWVVYENQVFWKSEVEKTVTAGLYSGDKEVTDTFKIASVGKTISVKASVLGKETSNIEVTVSANDYLVWDARNKVLKTTKIPSSDGVTVEITVTIQVGSERYAKKITLFLKDAAVTPIQPGGDYNVEDDYENPYEHKVTPIQPGGNFNAGDYEDNN